MFQVIRVLLINFVRGGLIELLRYSQDVFAIFEMSPNCRWKRPSVLGLVYCNEISRASHKEALSQVQCGYDLIMQNPDNSMCSFYILQCGSSWKFSSLAIYSAKSLSRLWCTPRLVDHGTNWKSAEQLFSAIPECAPFQA